MAYERKWIEKVRKKYNQSMSKLMSKDASKAIENVTHSSIFLLKGLKAISK